MSTNSEWTVLEKLLLTQAVYKYGENMWFQVARVLKQHGLLQPNQRQSDFFSQKVTASQDFACNIKSLTHPH
jgi:bromodomain-containing protein 8